MMADIIRRISTARVERAIRGRISWNPWLQSEALTMAFPRYIDIFPVIWDYLP